MINFKIGQRLQNRFNGKIKTIVDVEKVEREIMRLKLDNGISITSNFLDNYELLPDIRSDGRTKQTIPHTSTRAKRTTSAKPRRARTSRRGNRKTSK